MPTTLVVTNDFPPRIGGIEAFVAQVCEFLDSDVVVLTSSAPGCETYDAEQPFRVVRRGRLLLPTPATARLAARLVRETRADRVVFGAATPLGLLARGLRRAGAVRIVALSHGHETWWARVPIARLLLRRIAADVDRLTVISEFTSGVIGRALGAPDRSKLTRLPPPVDTDRYRPGTVVPGSPRCVTAARLVPRKGVDVLLRAWRLVLDQWSDLDARPELDVIGDGRCRRRLAALVGRLDLSRSVRMLGALDREGVRAELRRGGVFALPMRTVAGGLNAEGLGLAALEAAACGLPVIVGDSGGAPETVRPGETGFVVDGRDPVALAERLVELFRDPARAAAMGSAGRRHVVARFGAPQARATLRAALDLP